jgi:type I restriction enzyme S subunit
VKTRTTPLDEAFWFQEGPGVRKWQFTNSGIKLLNVGNILATGDLDLSKTDRCLSREEVEKRYKHFLVDAGDLVIASSGISFDDDGLLRTRGVFVRRSHLPLCLNTSTIRFKSKGEADLRYLRFWLDSYEFRSQITRRVTGSAQQNFGPSHLEDIRISLPDLSEQQRIAGQLEQADRLRRSRRYALQMCDEFLPAAFLEMFGDPVRNTKGWDVQLSSEIGEVQGGLQQIARREKLPLRKPFLRVANVQRGVLNLSDIRKIGLTETEFRRTTLQKGDLLLVEGNGNPSEVGRAGMWDGSIDGCVHQNHLIRIRCERSRVLPVFLLSQLNSSRGMAYYLKHGRTTSGLVTISTGLVNEFPVLVPPLELQRQFEQVVERHTLLKCSNVEALRQADHLFQSLLHQAFTAQ